MDDLPTEIIVIILRYCGLKYIYIITNVCKLFRNIVDINFLKEYVVNNDRFLDWVVEIHKYDRLFGLVRDAALAQGWVELCDEPYIHSPRWVYCINTFPLCYYGDIEGTGTVGWFENSKLIYPEFQFVHTMIHGKWFHIFLISRHGGIYRWLPINQSHYVMFQNAMKDRIPNSRLIDKIKKLKFGSLYNRLFIPAMDRCGYVPIDDEPSFLESDKFATYAKFLDQNPLVPHIVYPDFKTKRIYEKIGLIHIARSHHNLVYPIPILTNITNMLGFTIKIFGDTIMFHRNQ